MQTNSDSQVPLGMKKTIDSIITMNPEYSYIYFDNDRGQKIYRVWIWHRVVSAYDETDSWCIQSRSVSILLSLQERWDLHWYWNDGIETI